MRSKPLNTLSAEAVESLLGLEQNVPLEIDHMARQLCVTFSPNPNLSDHLKQFATRLQKVLLLLDAQVLTFDDALDTQTQKVKTGTVIFAPGETRTEELAINLVSNLYNNPVIGIYEGPCPAHHMQTTQEKLDAIVGVLAWHMIHIAIFVDTNSWTICTMNGGITTYSHDQDFQTAVKTSLVPKLTAQVVPPNKSHNIRWQSGRFDPKKPQYQEYLNEFSDSGKIWAENELMLSHTCVESLEYRNAFYKRIVKTYLDHRSGMSYGFFAHQLPVIVKPAFSLPEAQTRYPGVNWHEKDVVFAGDKCFVKLSFNEKKFVLEVPEVWVLSTRSGCNKTNLEPETDIVRMGLCNGEIILEPPIGHDDSLACNPSYDTLTILSHALGNALLAGLFMALQINHRFTEQLQTRGCSLTHWHHYLERSTLPDGHFLHGAQNPSVACSTPQSAIYALLGKFNAFEMACSAGKEFLGDVQVEPDHGTNFSSVLSLSEAARWINRHFKLSMANPEHIEG
jgi:hypothetical protein